MVFLVVRVSGAFRAIEQPRRPHPPDRCVSCGVLCRVGAARSIGRGPAEAGLSGVYEWFLVVRVSGAFLSVCTASRFIHYTTAVVALPGLFRCTCRSCERPRQFPWASPGA